MTYALETNRREIKQMCSHDSLFLIALLYENEVAVYEFDKSSSRSGESSLKAIWSCEPGQNPTKIQWLPTNNQFMVQVSATQINLMSGTEQESGFTTYSETASVSLPEEAVTFLIL